MNHHVRETTGPWTMVLIANGAGVLRRDLAFSPDWGLRVGEWHRVSSWGKITSIVLRSSSANGKEKESSHDTHFEVVSLCEVLRAAKNL